MSQTAKEILAEVEKLAIECADISMRLYEKREQLVQCYISECGIEHRKCYRESISGIRQSYLLGSEILRQFNDFLCSSDEDFPEDNIVITQRLECLVSYCDTGIEKRFVWEEITDEEFIEKRRLITGKHALERMRNGT